MHADDESESPSYVPAIQSMQEVVPAAAYLPAPHDAHSVAGSLSASAYPATQSVQDVDPAAEY